MPKPTTVQMAERPTNPSALTLGLAIAFEAKADAPSAVKSVTSSTASHPYRTSLVVARPADMAAQSVSVLDTNSVAMPAARPIGARA